MGYSHKWNTKRSFSDLEWAEITRRFKEEILTKYSNVIAAEIFDQVELPIIGDDYIQFNGVDGEGCESFCLEKGKHSYCCKTNELPYDAAVVATLKIAKDVAPRTIELKSDGGSEVFDSNNNNTLDELKEKLEQEKPKNYFGN